MFVDSHCHLDRLKLEECGGSLEAALENARKAQVEHLLCVCISAQNRLDVLAIAESDPKIFASAGVHPSDVGNEIVSVDTLHHWCDHPKVVALGETGLDYHYGPLTKDQQIQSFVNHLQAGKDLRLPVIVHTREAQQDTLRCIKEHACMDSSGVMHCFTEDWDMAKAALEANFYISLSGIVSFRNAESLREVAKKIPLDRLLIETDAPYLAPVPYRGKSNQPSYLPAVAQCIAEVRGISLQSLALATTDNFFRLFSHAIR
jgi:TatD DNase family protein